MKQYSQKLYYLLLSFLILTSACSKSIDKNPVANSGGEGSDSSGISGGGGFDSSGISLTTPVAHTGDVPYGPDPDPVPQVSDVYQPFVGVWKNEYLAYTYVFLPDGRVAIKKENNGTYTANIGVYYKIDNDLYKFVWKLTDEENGGIWVRNAATLAINTVDYANIGDAGSAEVAYNQIYNDLKIYAQKNDEKFPVGNITNTTSNQEDPKPNNVIKGANVFTTGVHFEHSFTSTKWYDMPDGTVNGFDGYSRTDVWLMPNGRFFIQLWLWDGVNPADKMESYKHQFSWGKYTVIKGSDVMNGDIINFYYDTGETAAYKTVGGQTCFLVKSIMYHQK